VAHKTKSLSTTAIGVRDGGAAVPGLEKCQGTLCFQDKRKLLKSPECKKYIQYGENFQSKLCFSRQAQVAQKL